jgi:hypothetical protein
LDAAPAAGANVVLFPAAAARNREEIQHLAEWRDHIYANWPASDLGNAMAGFLLERISKDIDKLSGRAA